MRSTRRARCSDSGTTRGSSWATTRPGGSRGCCTPKQGRHKRPPDYVIPVGRSVIVPANASLSNIILSPQSMLRMRRIWEEERFDVVHVHEPLAPILSVFALATAPCPIVATCHSAGERAGLVSDRRRGSGAASVDRIDHRIAVSESGPARGGAERRRADRGDPERDRPAAGGRLRAAATATSSSSAATSRARVCRCSCAPGREVHQQTGARLRLVGADPLSVRWLARRQGFSLDGHRSARRASEEELTAELQAREPARGAVDRR